MVLIRAVLGARQLALFVSGSIERGTRWVTIEGNTARTREQVCRQVETFLRQLAEEGALAGAERNRHYFVLCDQRLNDPLHQAEGVFRLVYGYQSVHGATRLCWLVEHRPDRRYHPCREPEPAGGARAQVGYRAWR